MSPTTIGTILGIACIIAGVYIITTVKEVTLTPNLSRLVAVLFATFGYFFLVARIPGLSNPAFSITPWAVGLALVGCAAIYGYRVYKNPDEAFRPIALGSAKVTSTVVLFAVARFLFSLM